MAAATLSPSPLVYNSANTAVTVTSNYASTTLKSSNYSSSVVTITSVARDKALSIEGNAKANKIVGTSANDTINGAAGNDTLTGGAGSDIFIFDGKGTDVITDYAAGEDTLKLTSGTVGGYSISGGDATFKVGSGSVKVSGGKNKAVTVIDSKNKTYIYDSGLIYNDSVAKAKAVSVSAAYGNTLASYGASVVTIDSSARTKAINIQGNAAANVITGTSGNDTINGGAGNDTLIGGKGKDLFVYESGGGNDFITDYTAGQDTIKIVGDSISSYSISGSDATFKIGSNTLKVKNGKSAAVLVVDENKNVSLYQSGAIYNAASATKATAITITSAYGNSFTAGTSAGSVDASERKNTINLTGNTKNNYLVGGAGKDIIDGGKGNDSIAGGKGADVLTGGAGADVFIYADGDGTDAITDYVSGEDVIKLVSGAVKSYSVKNGDAILKVGSGAITLKGAGNSAVSVLDASDVLTVYNGGLIYNDPKISRADVVTITADFDGEFDSYGASVEKIDAAARSKAIEITGNGADNFILGGKGKDTINAGKGADTIYAGKGNDLLTGGAGADVFFYATGDCNDTITDYGTGDIISVEGSVSYSTKNDDAVLKIGTASLTLKDAANTAVTVVSDNVASIYSGSNVSTETFMLVTIPSDALQYNGHSYYIYDTGTTWDEAKNYAERVGGHLVAITDSGEQNAVKNLLAAHSNPKNSYWLGGYRDDTLGWQWITGETWSYTNWGWGQPDGDHKDGVICDALMMYCSSANGWSLGSWNDFFRDGENWQDFFGKENFGYIVEWETVTSSASGGDTVYVTLEPETVTVGGGETVTVEVTLPAETITVGGGEVVTVEVTLPAETITVDGGEAVTVTVGGGGSGSIIAGTSGADTLYGTAGNDTFTGGAGADIFVYEGGNDFDVITDYTVGEDKISIGTSSVKSGILAGNDVIFAVGNGILKLNNAKGKTVTIFSGVGVESVYSNGILDTVNAGARTVTLESDRTAAFSLSAYNSTTTLTASNVNGSSVRNAIAIYGDDSANIIWGATGGGSIFPGMGNDVIYGGAGNDTIFYWSNGGDDTIYDYKTGDVIKMRRVDEDDTTTFENFSISGNDVIINFTSGNKITLKEAGDQYIDLRELNYTTSWYDYNSRYASTFGYVTISSGIATLNKKYQGYFRPSRYSDNPATIDASAVTTLMTIYGDDRVNLIQAAQGGTSIYAGKGNDTIYGGAGNDTIFYWSNDGNETIYDYKTGDQIRMKRVDEDDTTTFKNFSVSGNDVIINFTNSSTITLKDAGDQYIDLRELNYTTSWYDYNSRSYSTFGYVTISGGTATLNKKYSGYFRPSLYAENPATIDASAVTTLMTIYGDDRANLIRASKGGTSIFAGNGNDTIYFGDGYDTIFHWSNDGNETIYDYKTGDVIKMRRVDEDDTTTFKNFSVSDNDVTINFTNGSKITLKDAGDQRIDLRELNYTTSWYDYNSRSYSTFGYVTISGGTVTLHKKYQGNCATYYYANVTNIDASNVTVSTNLYGDDKANTLKMSNAGGSVNGGAGNDTIYCGSGRDSIMYYSGDGSDVIYNIGANDYISLNGCTAERVSVSGTDVIVKIADSSSRITLKEATGKNIYITGQGWQTYTATNGNAAVPWFAEDDTNFTTGTDLDELMTTPIASSAGALSVSGGDSLSAFAYDFALAHTDDK